MRPYARILIGKCMKSKKKIKNKKKINKYAKPINLQDEIIL